MSDKNMPQTLLRHKVRKVEPRACESQHVDRTLAYPKMFVRGLLPYSELALQTWPPQWYE